MKRIRALIHFCWRAGAAALWFAVGLWTLLATVFTVPGPAVFAYLLPLGVAAIYWLGWRERFRLIEWRSISWQQKKFTTLALGATIIYGVYYFGFIRPDNNQMWALEQDRKPVVSIEGDKVHVQNVRNFSWRSATDFDVGWYERTYDLNKLESMYYVIASMAQWEAVAHVFVCFGFSDGQNVAISVEGHRLKGRPYGVVSSLFRQFQLIYIIGDERDVVGLRGAIWKDPVYFYPARTTPERKRAIFIDMMKRAHSLEEQPEFYHLLFNNCMNNITYHLRRLGGRPLPHDLQLLLTGLSDRVAHRLGYIDTELPFEKARQAFRVDRWMQQTPLDEGFSERLREAIQRQEEAAKAGVGHE